MDRLRDFQEIQLKNTCSQCSGVHHHYGVIMGSLWGFRLVGRHSSCVDGFSYNSIIDNGRIVLLWRVR
jgi:hypothetical protein